MKANDPRQAFKTIRSSFKISTDYNRLRFNAVVAPLFHVGHYYYEVSYVCDSDPAIAGTIYIYQYRSPSTGREEWREQNFEKFTITVDPFFIQAIGKSILFIDG